MNEKEKPKRLSVKQVKRELDEFKDKILTRQRLFKRTAIITTAATFSIAVATIWYLNATLRILGEITEQTEQTQQTVNEMRTANQIQTEYYQKTVRPFVYAHSFTFENIEEPINNASLVKPQYSLTNVGALPAKHIRHLVLYYLEVNEEFKALAADTFDWREDETEIRTALFPGQEIYGFRSILRKPINVQYLMDNKWAHILVAYEDVTGEQYFHKWIVELRIILEGEMPSTQLKLNPRNKWADFN